MRTIRQQVMITTWGLVKYSGLTFRVALKRAWNQAKIAALKTLLRSHKLIITFLKVNGEVTTRTATRNTSFIPSQLVSKEIGNTSDSIVNFYSEGDNGWRSFRNENLISFSIA